jgi:hypothetical protein
MRHFTSRDPPNDGGYPADSDLHQMSDDGGPVGPDPARWADPVWRDNPGESGPTKEGRSALYVLANPSGWLYQHDLGGMFHNCSLRPGPAERRPGAQVLVFDTAALADRFLVRHALFGDEFRARPARTADRLGDTVCRVSVGADGGDSFSDLLTPAGAIGGETSRTMTPDGASPLMPRRP